MKNKPHRHKETNLFKFIPFTERIAHVKIDVIHHIKHKYELDTCQTTTHLYEAYEKWIVLNSSESFTELRQDISNDIRILPQLLARKEELVDALKKHLSAKNLLNLQPTLEFVVALANDLREEFYPYFPSIYEHLMNLLDSKDVDLLEWVFQCLAFLFKLLWRYLINELSTVFESLIPLLDKSKPTYINNFAAQSFAFVARKVKDESKLIKLIIRTLKEKPHAVEGCGRLVFEIVHGVQGQWHSCGEKIFTSLISALREPSYPHSILCQLLSETLSHLLAFLSVREHVLILWKILQNSLSDFCKELQNEPTDRNLANAEQVLCMVLQAVEYRHCSALVEPAPLLRQLLGLLQLDKLTDRICSIISHVLLNAAKLPQELSSSVVLGALDSLEGKVLLEFALQIRTFSGFEGIVLPRLLGYCLENVAPQVALPYLAQLAVSKAPPAEDSRQLMVYQPYSINFSSARKGDPTLYGSFCLSVLKGRNVKGHLEHLDDCVMILLVLPHLLPLAKSEAITALVSLLEAACGEMDAENPEPLTRVLYLLCATLEAIICLKPEVCITKLISPIMILPILIKYANEKYLFALRALDSYVSLDELNLIQPFAEDLKTNMYPQLMSPYQKVRLYTTHILYEVEKSEGSNVLMSSVLDTCWSTECIPPTLAEYRQRLKVLRKLDCSSNDNLREAVTKGDLDARVPLRYLLGHLFINFKLLWEPVSKIIVSYSGAMEPGRFWEIYREQMDSVAAEIREVKEEESPTLTFVCKNLEDLFSCLNDLKEKPDHIKYRIMLWKLLKEFPDTIYEAKSKDIVIRFFKFIDEEYNKRYSDAAASWDIRLKTHTDISMQDTDLLMDIDEEAKDSEDKEEPIEEPSLQEEPVVNFEISPVKNDEDLKKELTKDDLPEVEWKTKWITKSLIAHMGIFGKFRSPKSLFREPELNKMFCEFLSSRIPDVQRCALDFIMQYKLKYLFPYRDNVYGLMDDKTFKNELTVFRVDKQSDAIRPEHRPHLIPIVLRIVYSKMYSKVNASRRETKQGRKAAILRFLSGCSSDELFNFFKMAFSHLIDQIEDDATAMVRKIMDSFDPEHCTPPRRLTATAHLLRTVLTYCGGLLDQEQAAFLLRLILIVSAHPPAILSRRDEVHPGYIKVIKNVRAVCFQVAAQFYEVYEEYKWSEDETNAVFLVLVWPYLKSLASEAVNSPTTQFKLFNTWSKNPKLFGLLDKKDQDGRSILTSLMELWTSPKLHGSVHNTLLELASRLLAEEAETDEPVSGKEILSEYVPKILKLLQDRLTTKKSLTKRELHILSAITSSPAENVSPECLLSFILPSLLKSSKKDDEEVTQLLTTADNLMKGVANPELYLRQIVPLFSSLSTPQHRKLLLSLTLTISASLSCPLDNEIILGLNAWDSKWIDQPDFSKRLQAFTAIDRLEAAPSVTMAVIVTHTAFYYLRDEKDLSLKDAARHCLRTLCPRVCLSSGANKADLSFLLNDTLFPLLNSCINGKIEHLRQEAILILGHMVRECSSLHYVFSDLFPLSNKSDLEVDFFENLVHLQLHRRVRAMLRFSEISEKVELSWNSHTLVNFIYPMISYFLLSPKYAEKNTIIDSAIKAVGSICRLLPWKYYSAILRNYLGKLKSSTDFHKQMIRIVSEILNAFHFNLSEAGNFNTMETSKSEETTINNDSDKLEETVAALEIDDDNNEEKIEEQSRDLPLPKPAAEKIVKELSGVILPNLQSLMAHKNIADSYHKINKKTIIYERDEEDILRAPLAIAVVKLLQKLPSPALLKRNLPGILMKLCTLLKSHGEAVRRTARTTLETVMVSLGPKYLHTLLSELVSLLTRGFQVHVLAYTVHGVLQALRPMYNKGDLDVCVHQALEVCTADLFGAASEEKEVNQITAKTVEARANRSFDILHILASYSSEKFLLDILLPLKEELSRTVSQQTINKATNCLQQIALGLTENKFLEPEALLELAYGVSTESIPALLAKESITLDTKQLEYESRKDPDIYIIPEEPKQKKALMSSECSKTNAHILVEFGLKLLYFLLKREKLKKETSKVMLNPLVKHLLDCISSQHVKVSTLAVQCLPWLVRMRLDSIQEHLKPICSTLFQILHRFASAGLSKGDNFDLVMATFKMVGTMVRDVERWSISAHDRRVLLLYCEQDIEDRERQATAFSLLKALINRHIDADELNSVMKKVANVSITSQIDSVRLQARQVMLTYLMEYKLGGEVLRFLSFYLGQLGYTTKVGRQSTLEMISSLVAAFPLERLKDDSSLIFINVATRLINEEEADCKIMAANLISLLLKKLDQNNRDKLFDVVTAWITGKKVLHRQLGMQLAGLFANTEKEDFARRLEVFLSLAVEEFRTGFGERKPGRFVLLHRPEEEGEDKERLMDHLAFHSLQSVLKVLTVCPVTLKDNKYQDHVNTIREECHGLLAHEHEWVRTSAVHLLGLILTTKKESVSKGLVLDLVSQLVSSASEQLLKQCMKLLVYIAERASSSDNNSADEDVSVQWLVRKVRHAVNKEVVHSPSEYQIRMQYCRWAAALSLKLERTTLLRLAPELLVPVVKEQSSENEGLAEAAKQAGGYLKGKLGQAEYTSLVSRISATLQAKRAVRKTERAQLAVIDPEGAAKRKIKKQLKKKVLKKRKIELIKSHKFKKKPKMTELSIEDD